MNRRDALRLASVALGGMASGGLARALQAGASPEDGAGERFGAERLAMVERLADMIIPATDTPGALAAGVPDFMAAVVFDWQTPAERTAFLDGLERLDQRSRQRYGNPFHLAAEAECAALLGEEERLGPSGGESTEAAAEGVGFFPQLRELVVYGYYTSEVGGQQELIYRPVPGEYDGDYDYARVGRLWSY